MLVIIDDNIELLEALKEFFQEKYPTETFSNGHEAIRYVSENPTLTGVCLIDYAMPNFNGVDTTKRIKELNKDCLVIMMSGFVDFSKVEELLKNRTIHQFFTKPVNMERLDKTIEGAVRLYLKKSAL